jgi:hypothetical protein
MIYNREEIARRREPLNPLPPPTAPEQEVRIAKLLCELTEEMNILLWDRYFHLFREHATQNQHSKQKEQS